MNSLYNHGLKQTQTITKDLAQFEKNLSTSPLSLQGAITTSITAFKKTIKEYSDLLRKTQLTRHMRNMKAGLASSLKSWKVSPPSLTI